MGATPRAAISCKIPPYLTCWQADLGVNVTISLLKVTSNCESLRLDFTRVDESADATFQKV